LKYTMIPHCIIVDDELPARDELSHLLAEIGGVDKTGEEILAASRENKVDVIGLSALLTTTIPRMKECIELLEESGIRRRYKVIVGGAPVTQ